MSIDTSGFMGHLLGYARVSTGDQDAQLRFSDGCLTAEAGSSRGATLLAIVGQSADYRVK